MIWVDRNVRHFSRGGSWRYDPRVCSCSCDPAEFRGFSCDPAEFRGASLSVRFMRRMS